MNSAFLYVALAFLVFAIAVDGFLAWRQRRSARREDLLLKQSLRGRRKSAQWIRLEK